jgi:uncharacterized protein YutD
MKALNRKERKKANVRFIAMFLTTLLLMFGCSFFVLKIAGEGVKVLETKHKTYTKAFENQAFVTFKMEEIIDKIYSLKTTDRSINEQKNLQGLISNIRLDIEKLIREETTELKEFELYTELLAQVSVIQNTIDLFEEDELSHRYNQKLLERCREKYRVDKLGEVTDKEENE